SSSDLLVIEYLTSGSASCIRVDQSSIGSRLVIAHISGYCLIYCGSTVVGGVPCLFVAHCKQLDRFPDFVRMRLQLRQQHHMRFSGNW
ncbi:hypothetical protein PanWU01x14_133590, partial [Parasponia andersonii]